MEEKKVIAVSVGRVLLYYPGGRAEKESGCQPRAAQVAYVHDDRHVNIGFLSPSGQHDSASSVVLRQPDDETPTGAFCEWMEYQIKTAGKA